MNLPSAVYFRLACSGAFVRQPVTDEGESQVRNPPIRPKGLSSPFGRGIARFGDSQARKSGQGWRSSMRQA
jgi:hypothetical protein